MSKKNQVVVTGVGTLSPLGNNVNDTWSAMLEARSGIDTLKCCELSELEVKFGGEVKNCSFEDFLPKKDLRRMDRFIQLGLVASFEAIEQSQFEDHYSKDRIATILSSGVGGLKFIEESVLMKNSGKRVSPFFIPAVISNLLPGQLSLLRGYQGANFCITSACSSSAHSIGEGSRMIERGDADVVVAGGAEAPLTPISLHGFAAMKALSTRNEDPQKASRPFDEDRDGFVMSEGAATLILENKEMAEKRGAAILAEVVGYGANADAYHLTAPHVEGLGAKACMNLALKDAGLNAEQVQYINMHGTSTPAGDKAESKAIESLFPHWDKGLICSSTKSMSGHLLGAAGALEAIAVIQSLRDQKIAPTINIENQDEECRLDYCPHERKSVEGLEYALTNSFGFGGTNASIIFKKY